MIDLLIHSAAQLATCAGPGPRRGAAMRDVGIISDGAVAIHAGRILAVGPSIALRAAYQTQHEIDARGQVVCPGLIDPHTHVVYAGDRIDEFEQRIGGATYQEIMAAGGGIRSTMRATRQASLEQLVAASRPRLMEMLRLGTTTAEVKTGYGLDQATELRQLAAIAQLDRAGPLALVPTFMPAHAVPPEFDGRPDAYVDLVVDELLPAAAAWYRDSHFARNGVPLFVDVFCEHGAFDAAQTQRILLAAQRLGLPGKAHVDEFSEIGGLDVALQAGCVSVDHLDVTGPAGIAQIAESSAVAVVIPLVPINLGGTHFANARAMIDAGAAVALTTDLNPGSAPAPSMPLAMAIACRYQHLLPAEALIAATLNAAHAIGMETQIGSIEPGKQADLLMLAATDYRHLAYQFGGNLVRTVIKAGQIVSSEVVE